MRRVVLPLRTWLVLSHLAALLLPVVALVATRALAIDLRIQTRDELNGQAVLLGIVAAREVEVARMHDPSAGLDDVAARLTDVLVATKARTLAGLRVVGPDGVVVASSGDGVGDDLSEDVEVLLALSGDVAVAVKPHPGVRSSAWRGSGIRGPSRQASVRLFVSAPVTLDGEVLGAVVLSRTPREELQAFAQMAPRLWWGVLAALLATIALSGFAGWLGGRSLRRMARAAPGIAAQPGEASHALSRPRASHVAEVAAVAEALTETAARLDARIHYIGEFASNVSHEFKTPLSTLRGTVELLQDDADMPPEQRARFLANALAELDRLERLVSGLLALARAERSEVREDVDLDAVVDAVVARWPGTERSGHAGTVTGDPAQLEVAVENLVANAHRHGGGVVRVACSTASVTIEDDGPGISEANRDKVFDRFFTTARTTGTGLGLALVRAIVQAHGGDVDVESAPGRTRFTIRLRP